MILRLTIATLLCISLSGPAMAMTPTDVEKTLMGVSQLSANSQFGEALDQLKTAIKAQPDQVPLHLAYIEVLLRVEQREDAQRVYRALLDADPTQPTSHFLYGKTLPDAALRKAEYEKALALEPTHPWAHLGMAAVAVTEAKFDDAIEFLFKSLEAAPTLEPALEMMGTILAARGQLGDAIITYQALELADPVTGRASEALGRLYLATGQPSEAMAAYQRAVKVQPDRPSNHANLGHLYFSELSYAEAYASYGKAVELDPYDELSKVMMDVTDRVRDGSLPHEVVLIVQEARAIEEQAPLKALEKYGEAVAMAPDFALAQLGYGRLLIAVGEVEKGIATLNKAMELAPDLYEARMTYGRLMLELNQLQQAEKHLTYAAKLQPMDPEVHMALGVVFTTSRNPRGAEIAYRNAIPLLEREAAMAAWVNLSGALAAQGRLEEAAKELEQIQTLLPEQADVAANLASVYLAMERFADAQIQADRALKLEPGNETATELLPQIKVQEAKYKTDVATKKRASQILVKTRDDADAILVLLNDGEAFAVLARTKSIGPEAIDGGDLGFFEPGELSAELSRALDRVQVGETTGIVKSSAGYHILLRTN